MNIKLTKKDVMSEFDRNKRAKRISLKNNPWQYDIDKMYKYIKQMKHNINIDENNCAYGKMSLQCEHDHPGIIANLGDVKVDYDQHREDLANDRFYLEDYRKRLINDKMQLKKQNVIKEREQILSNEAKIECNRNQIKELSSQTINIIKNGINNCKKNASAYDAKAKYENPYTGYSKQLGNMYKEFMDDDELQLKKRSSAMAKLLGVVNRYASSMMTSHNQAKKEE